MSKFEEWQDAIMMCQDRNVIIKMIREIILSDELTESEKMNLEIFGWNAFSNLI